MAVAAAAAVMALAGCSGERTEPRAWERGGGSVDLRGVRLASTLTEFDSCDAFLDEVRAQATKQVGPYGFSGWSPVVTADVALAGGDGRGEAVAAGGATAMAGAPAFSSTNVQEDGVDEPDSVKTDGEILLTLANNRLEVLDVTGTPRKIASLRFDDHTYATSMFLVGDSAVVLSGGGGFGIPEPMPGRAVAGGGVASDSMHPHGGGQATTRVTIVDVSDPAKPRVVTTTAIEGDLVAARLVDGTPRLVLRSHPNLRFASPQGANTATQARAQERDATAANRAVVAKSDLDDWLPEASVGGGAPEPVVDCNRVAVPAEPSGVGTVTVVSVDAEDGSLGEAVSVLADAQTVYASAERLYVATSEWRAPRPDGRSEDVTTEIHRFDLTDDEKARYEGSGAVEGYVLNQFSMSEHEGRLRVATTTGEPMAGGDSESAVRVLELRGDKLEQVGMVGGLGKGERIYSVRFIGELGYVVTFRQVDPLYVIDLRDPTKPTVEGELKINGYSAYLHPVGEGRLLGIGQDATDDGRRLGTQVSLFDVRDPKAPKRVGQATLGQGDSSAEHDHHAFLWWAETGTVVIPLQSYGERGPSFIGAVALDVDPDAGRVVEKERISHPFDSERGYAMVERSVVLGDRLLTVSQRGVMVNDLETLDQQAWVAF